VLGWLPRGTHRWDRFITPGELRAAMTDAGLSVADEAGVVYNPLTGEWRLSDDKDVNYMVTATRPGRAA
jgi:2-polyprenyl-6-hydroxyphenyl methylase/3-demethylubiquinone-9 3-methyltransferase